PLGHFGLATDCYTHFTSPIRRYPDLVIHRLLDVALRHSGRVPPDLPDIAAEASGRERIAMEAEREIVQLKKIQFMQDKVGETHSGFISGTANFGLFVELADVFVEGLLHVSTLGDDFYQHDERAHCLRGRRTRRTFRLGDAIRVTVAGVSVERRQIDFALADQEMGSRRGPGRRGGRPTTARPLTPAPLAPAVPAAARGAETDPARRNMVVEAVEKASPAVVNISTEEVVEQRGSPFPYPSDPFFDEFFRDFTDPRPRRFTRASLGSGGILASDGTILTNEHLVLRASR